MSTTLDLKRRLSTRRGIGGSGNSQSVFFRLGPTQRTSKEPRWPRLTSTAEAQTSGTERDSRLFTRIAPRPRTPALPDLVRPVDPFVPAPSPWPVRPVPCPWLDARSLTRPVPPRAPLCKDSLTRRCQTLYFSGPLATLSFLDAKRDGAGRLLSPLPLLFFPLRRDEARRKRRNRIRVRKRL